MTARTIPTLPTWAAGQRVLAANLASMVSYQQFWADPPMFRMYQAVTQSIPNAAITQVAMDTLVYDTDSGRGASTPYSYTVPVGMTGRWAFTVHIPMSSGSSAEHDVYLLRNGSPVASSQITDAVSALTSELTTLTVAVNAGDVMGAAVFQQTGGNESTFVGANIMPTFEGRLISLGNP